MAYLHREVKAVPYHSTEWGDMVEQGWITVTVDEYPAYVRGPVIRWATMLRETRERTSDLL